MLKVFSIQQLLFVLLILILMVSSTSNYVRKKLEYGRKLCFTTLSSSNKETGDRHSVEATHNLNVTPSEDDHLKGFYYN